MARDPNLRLQYIGGMGANLYRGGDIYNPMAAYKKFPDAMFMGSPHVIDAARAAMSR